MSGFYSSDPFGDPFDLPQPPQQQQPVPSAQGSFLPYQQPQPYVYPSAEVRPDLVEDIGHETKGGKEGSRRCQSFCLTTMTEARCLSLLAWLSLGFRGCSLGPQQQASSSPSSFLSKAPSYPVVTPVGGSMSSPVSDPFGSPVMAPGPYS